MTDSIGAALKTAVGNIIPLYFAEAETSSYPFAVYDRTMTEHRTKDGVYKIQSELTLIVVSKSFSEVKTKAAAVRTAIDGLDSSKYIVKFLSSSADCVDDVWTTELTYNIYQTK